MLKKEHVLMICVGVLLLSCVYLLWDNKRLNKRLALKTQEVVVNKQSAVPEAEYEQDAEPDAEPDAEQDAEQDAEPEAEPDAEAEQDGENNNGMDYYVNENIPDDLKEELNNLNLEDEEPKEFNDEILEFDELDVGLAPLESMSAPLESMSAPLESMSEDITNQIGEFVEEIIIDIKPENDELLDLELQLEKKISVALGNEKHTEDSLNAMTLKQLTDICRDKKLKIKGKKSELVERILSM